jgi:hypothetical protein
MDLKRHVDGGGIELQDPAKRHNHTQGELGDGTVGIAGGEEEGDAEAGYDASPASGRWTKQEDERLRAAVSEYGASNWKQISLMMKNGKANSRSVRARRRQPRRRSSPRITPASAT